MPPLHADGARPAGQRDRAVEGPEDAQAPADRVNLYAFYGRENNRNWQRGRPAAQVMGTAIGSGTASVRSAILAVPRERQDREGPHAGHGVIAGSAEVAGPFGFSRA
jgi:hypothetical protein